MLIFVIIIIIIIIIISLLPWLVLNEGAVGEAGEGEPWEAGEGEGDDALLARY